MGPKSRKSVSLWQSCERCSSIISSKDLEIHDNECSEPVSSRTHLFIHNKVLFARVEEIKASEIDEHVRSYKNDLIFISESAMQICGFIIGDPVVISTKRKKFVRKAWPKNEGSLTSAKMCNSGSLDFDPEIFKETISISNFTSCPLPAKEVHFKFRNPISNVDSFLNILQSKFKLNIYNVGSEISVLFYGQTVIIEIVKCVPVSSDEDCLNLSQLSLEDTFYLIIEKTKWKPLIMKNESTKCEKTINLSLIGGYKSIIDELKRDIDLTFKSPIKTTADGQMFCGILLYGGHGTGKSLIAEALANDSGTHVIKAQASDLSSSRLSNEGQRKIHELFNEACSSEPCVLIVDSIDSLAPANLEGEDRKTLAALARGFDIVRRRRIVLISTAVSPDNVHSSLRRPGRLENEIEIGVPTEEERKEILLKYVPEAALLEGVKEAASVTHGYVAADLAAVVAQARSHAMTSKTQLAPADLAWAVRRVTPSAMRQAQLQVNKVKWEDIGGQDDLKLKLKQAVEWPLLYPEAFTRLGISPPRGILMFGPPGCSKTMIAKAIATETSLNFLSVKGSDIFSKWVGESERAVRELFGRARRVAPAVIFLDEVDAICPARDGSTHGGGSAVQDRVLSQLLTEMDGVQPLNDVIIIAATNRPDRIDKAFLRPGRLDRLIYVPLPSYETRLQVLKVKTKKTPLSACVDLSVLAQNTEGYSGAEIVAVCNEAAMKALEEDMSSSHVKMEHFIAALKSVTPRTPQSLIKIYEDYVNKSSLK